MTFPVPFQPPTDGFTTMEVAFLKRMVIDVYKIIPRAEDKFILIAVQEMGYPQEVVAQMLGKSQNTICARLQKIKIFIRNHKLMKDMQ